MLLEERVETDQQLEARLFANERRLLLKKLKRDMRVGRLLFKNVILDHRDDVAKYPMWEVMSWQRGLGVVKMVEVNRRAVLDGVNLAVPVGRASLRTVTWAMANMPDYSSGLSTPLPPKVDRMPMGMVGAVPFRDGYVKKLNDGWRSVDLARACGYEHTAQLVNVLNRKGGMVRLDTAMRIGPPLGVDIRGLG